MKEVTAKIGSFFNRVIRYFVFSTLLSFSVMTALIIVNLIIGVRVSLGFYLMLMMIFDIMLTTLISAFNTEKLFIPISKPLIKKVEKERLERARRSRDNKRTIKKIS